MPRGRVGRLLALLGLAALAWSGPALRARPGVRDLRSDVSRGQLSTVRLPPRVPSLPGTSAVHPHSLRLSTAGVQSVHAAELRLLSDVLDAVAAAAGLGPLQGAAAGSVRAAAGPDDAGHAVCRAGQADDASGSFFRDPEPAA